MRDACLHTYPLPDVGRRYSELRCGWSACLVSRRTPTIHRREKISCRVSEQPLGGPRSRKCMSAAPTLFFGLSCPVCFALSEAGAPSRVHPPRECGLPGGVLGREEQTFRVRCTPNGPRSAAGLRVPHRHSVVPVCLFSLDLFIFVSLSPSFANRPGGMSHNC